MELREPARCPQPGDRLVRPPSQRRCSPLNAREHCHRLTAAMMSRERYASTAPIQSTDVAISRNKAFTRACCVADIDAVSGRSMSSAAEIRHACFSGRGLRGARAGSRSGRGLGVHVAQSSRKLKRRQFECLRRRAFPVGIERLLTTDDADHEDELVAMIEYRRRERVQPRQRDALRAAESTRAYLPQDLLVLGRVRQRSAGTP